MKGIISGLVQLFFAWRIFVLTSSACLCGIVVLLALFGTAGGIATAAECGITSQFVQFQKFQDVVTIWLVSDCLCDIIITFLLVRHLVSILYSCTRVNIKTHKEQRGQKTGFKRSDDLIDKIIRITVQTGLITSVCALVDLITFLSLPTGIHLIFNLPLSKLYTNSLMSSLNSREPRQEPAASAPSTLSSANTAAYKHTSVSLTWPSQDEDHNAVALNSRRFLDVTSHSGDDIGSCLSIEMLQRDSGCAMIRNPGSSGSVSGTTPDFGICNPV
ncbi:hypothetical protein EDD18DRAFT_49162 [Armillaria luteobubalina]|uniref:DUF6534 domain-containing protein n=1 Tax=Armillaria luteobubalina TaxID=153913 RepID=A0AA39UYV7_9AGAR|nr:hypothetical protein EDD18DRAFT_49162 [Armillaria luteobubalina]